MKFGTIADAARLPQARVLAGSINRNCPGATLTVLLLASRGPQTEDEPFEVISPDDIDTSHWELLRDSGRWADLTEFFKPHLLSHLIADGADPAIYVDSAVDIHAPLEPLIAELGRWAVVLAPRTLGDLPRDNRNPDNRALREAGRLGASLIAMTREHNSLDLLDWWAERLTRAAEQLAPRSPGHLERASREMTSWIDLAPSEFLRIAVLADRGSAVSYWNLHERELVREGPGYTVDGRPLQFMHFEGFDPTHAFLLAPTEIADRVRVSANPALGELCETYSLRLIEAGWQDAGRRADIGPLLANGLAFDDRLSRLLADAVSAGYDFGDVFEEQGSESFARWLEGPAPHGREFGINRYLYRIWCERPDLRAAYPDLDGLDGSGFAGWAWEFGVSEIAIPERFLPPARRPTSGTLHSADTENESVRVMELPRGTRPQVSVNVTGLLGSTLGLGEAARGYVSALEAANVPVSTTTVDLGQLVDVSEQPHERYARVDYEELEHHGSTGFNLVCINPDELPRIADLVGTEFFRERPSIGVWAWETDFIPARWRRAYALVDEIWVYSRYVAANLEQASPVPVHVLPPAVSAPAAGHATLDLNLPDGFRFLFMFDFFSTIQRKNPVGLIRAFCEAFKPGEGPCLVVKTINGVHRLTDLEEVLWAARGRPDIRVVDCSLTARERDALVASCDCYVSLHRSEGFGLTLAECMLLGKPVIATAFSGTTDFMTDDNSYLVPYEMTWVGGDCPTYPAEGRWADPDIGVAATMMRDVVEKPEQAHSRGEQARQTIERLYAPPAAGEAMRKRLEEIESLWAGRSRLEARARALVNGQ